MIHVTAPLLTTVWQQSPRRMNLENKIDRLLDDALRNWNALSNASHDDAETTADDFEASFYRFIDAVREWYLALHPRPGTLEEMLDQPAIAAIMDRLPAPLYLNFETEVELMIDNISRVDEDRYD
jgi:hypothetical protein